MLISFAELCILILVLTGLKIIVCSVFESHGVLYWRALNKQIKLGAKHSNKNVKMVSEAEARQIYDSAIHFDGLNICNFGKDIFESWKKGGITGVSCTCGLWEGFRESIANVVQWKKWFEEYSDLIVQAHSVADIREAKKNGKTAVLLSWQNTAGIEDQIGYLRVFRDLGIRKMQLTYNTQSKYILLVFSFLSLSIGVEL